MLALSRSLLSRRKKKLNPAPLSCSESRRHKFAPSEGVKRTFGLRGNAGCHERQQSERQEHGRALPLAPAMIAADT